MPMLSRTSGGTTDSSSMLCLSVLGDADCGIVKVWARTGHAVAFAFDDPAELDHGGVGVVPGVHHGVVVFVRGVLDRELFEPQIGLRLARATLLQPRDEVTAVRLQRERRFHAEESHGDAAIELPAP